MRARASERLFIKHFVNRSRGIAAFLLGMMLMGSAAVDAVASSSEPVKKIDPLLEEDRIHRLSIFSYMPPLTRGRFLKRRKRYIPILITLNITGPKGLHAFCEFRPRINEAVLNVVTDDNGATDELISTEQRPADLQDMKDQILKAVNFSLPGAPVSSLDARAGRSPADFGKDMHETNVVCKKLDKLVK